MRRVCRRRRRPARGRLSGDVGEAAQALAARRAVGVLAPVVAHRHGSCRWETGAVAGSVRMKQVPAPGVLASTLPPSTLTTMLGTMLEAESGAALPETVVKKGRTRAGARPRCRGRCRRRASRPVRRPAGPRKSGSCRLRDPRSRGGRRCRSGWSAPGRAGPGSCQYRLAGITVSTRCPLRRRVGRMDVRISSITVCRSKRRRCELVWSAATA